MVEAGGDVHQVDMGRGCRDRRLGRPWKKGKKRGKTRKWDKREAVVGNRVDNMAWCRNERKAARGRGEARTVRYEVSSWGGLPGVEEGGGWW